MSVREAGGRVKPHSTHELTPDSRARVAEMMAAHKKGQSTGGEGHPASPHQEAMEEREEKLNRTLSHSNHIADQAEELCEHLDKAIDAAKEKENEKKRKKEEKKRRKEEEKRKKEEEKQRKEEDKQRKKEEKKLKQQTSGGGLFSRWRSSSSVGAGTDEEEAAAPSQAGGGGGGGGEEDNKAQSLQLHSEKEENTETYLDVVPHGGDVKHDSGIIVENDDVIEDDGGNQHLVFRGHTSATHATVATPLLASSKPDEDVGGCCTVM